MPYSRKVLRLILFTCFMVAFANANCDACMEGWCYAKKTLIADVNITDQLAIDRKNNILYVQINSEMITAIYLNDNYISKMKVVKIFKTSGLSVNPHTSELCTADYKKNVYKIKHSSNSTATFPGIIDGVVDLLYYENRLYFTKKGEKGLYFVATDEKPAKVSDLANYTITDFVKTCKGIVFVANDTVYDYKEPFDKHPKIVVTKNMVLATNGYNDVFLGDASQKIIYKKDDINDKLLIHAAYQIGNIKKFVFDKYNNVIMYDSTERNLAYWERQKSKCGIEPPRCTYHINMFRQFGPEFADEQNSQINSFDYY